MYRFQKLLDFVNDPSSDQLWLCLGFRHQNVNIAFSPKFMPTKAILFLRTLVVQQHQDRCNSLLGLGSVFSILDLSLHC